MPTYNYSAMNDLGRTVRGVLVAENDVDLEARLEDVGLDLIDYKVAREKKAGITAKVKQKDLIMMCMHLEQLSRAGVPIYEALQDVRDASESLKLRDIITDMCERVKAGERLSEALAFYPKVFSDVFIGLVRAGETNGNMTESFVHIADHMKWASELRRRVRKAIAYPAVLLVIMSLVITILMMFVVPQLIDFITSQGFDIPIHTRALMWTSDLFEAAWYWILGSPILIGIGLKVLHGTSPAFAYQVDRLALNLPVLGPAVRKINLARFTHFFAVMFCSGIDIIESLDAARHVVGNRVLAEAIETMTRAVTEGNSLTVSMQLSNQFPNLVVRMFKIGEDSGNMSDALENINFFYEREVNDSVDAVVGMVQPALTVVMGTLIFWVISAIFGPLYQSFQNMNF